MFDVNFVMDTYGLGGVFLEIALIEFVNAFLFQRAFADPCHLIYNYLRGRHTVIYSSLLLAVQFIAAYASWLISKQFFALNLHPQHVNAFDEECSADLTVAIIYGSIVEALGLFASKLAEFCIDERILPPNGATLINALCSGLITILGINITGMYANPIVAWALTFNCEGTSHFGHFVECIKLASHLK
uniref:Aquaporin n=1 Tax=Globodera pallida TaxID=36090 RepID=A0A183BVY3_GLOPA